ncbi:hypothetical protein IDM40_18780 [Nocardiopsis sp. HNM0947]|uniref:Uncharacterized protein n=1 Tax=Nocardiopsis coralli TaxID=2772213 RepID=A0ABR9PAL0_9ACTN|nr:hypothetical protein [Nocardiopsis coralli]MBE3000725.1 hypothetical protein [Nocardiopsis coralli]
MSSPNARPAVLLILATAVLGSAAVILTPALFDEFHAGRLIAIIALVGAAIATGFMAKRHRKKLTG